MINASKVEVKHIYCGRILNAHKMEAQILKLTLVILEISLVKREGLRCKACI